MTVRKNNWVFLATLGPLGYLPAPGTVGSLAAVPFIYAINYFFSQYNYYVSVQLINLIIFTLLVSYIIKKANSYFSTKDPREIVLDEFLGCLCAFFLLPITSFTLIFTFLLFRFFDITKIMGIKYLERLPVPWGIVVDDIAAGIIANIIMRIIVKFL